MTTTPFPGLPAVFRVRDNGTSANDPADQLSFPDVGTDACHGKPDLPLLDITGQVKVN